MNSAFLKTLKAKKRRARDPNAPPAPNLMSQAKDLRLTKQGLDRQEIELEIVKQRIDNIEQRQRRLESNSESFQNWVLNKLKR